MMEAPDPVVLADKRRRAEGIRLSNVILSRHLKGQGAVKRTGSHPLDRVSHPGEQGSEEREESHLQGQASHLRKEYRRVGRRLHLQTSLPA